MNDILRLEELPEMVVLLKKKVETMRMAVQELKHPKPQAPVWMDIKALRAYIPTHPSRQTIYKWCCEGSVPYHKVGGKNMFLKSEIDDWIISDGRKPESIIEQEAWEYVNSKKHA